MSSEPAQSTAEQGAVRAPFHSRGYLSWAVGLFFAMYLFNFIDRIILSAIGEFIKRDLHLSDLQLGLLGGLAFAAFFSVLSFVLARFAESHSRVAIVSISCAVWSVMTGLCGLAQNYWQLLLCRMGVGVGEAGFTPAVVSLISDYVPPNRRASTYSMVVLAVPLGAAAGAFVGGWTAQYYGWHTAFFVVGAPGLLLALLAHLTLREPPRGYSEGAALVARVAGEKPPSIAAVFGVLARKTAFTHLTLAASFTNMVGNGMTLFFMPFLARTFALDLVTAATIVGLLIGVSAGVGTAIGGFASDWAGKRDVRWYAWIPAIALTISAPIYALGFLQTNLIVAIALVSIGSMAVYAFLPGVNMTTQGMVEPRMRATTASVHALAQALLGLGLGPVLIGAASDVLAAHAFDTQGLGAFASVCPQPAETVARACQAASGAGVKGALVVSAGILFLAAGFYLLAARRLKRDMASAYR